MTPTGDLQQGPIQLALAVVIGVALIGFVVGIRAPDEDAAGPLAEDAAEDAGNGAWPAARSYTELRADPPGDDGWWTAAVARLDQRVAPGPTGEKSAAIASRAAHRAYDGAPPTIPHPIRQDSAPECLACHQDGLRIAGRLAPPMSHTSYTSCTQCHVVEAAPMPGVNEGSNEGYSNSFVGKPSPTAGARAWDIAPPTIPHSTLMRERCESCHGENGRDPLRTPHPERQSCTQCHAPSAELDLRPTLGSL